ncbi:hypothetical protein [Rhodococcus daqingensis]|uniref:Fe-S oxidoreductase n=1 Tax=Rhodococcus daqingensis TaxID=2479363 RepID=A0ABW2RUQ3_9NOCA
MVATAAALAYAGVLRARIVFDEEFDLFVCAGMRFGFARGGTTIGGAYLTGRNTGAATLRHEAVHAEQWARYGLGFGVRYLIEEIRHPMHRNRFEIEAGLVDGGYARRPKRPIT